MIGIGIGVNRQRFRGGGFDADYQAVLNYATTQGYTLPSEGQQTLQNQLMLDLKTAGVWSKLDTFAVFATDGDSDFALIDWKRLVDYTAVNSPTFTSDEGFAGNGTSSYIDTNFNPATQASNFTLNNASRYVYLHLASGNLSLDGKFSGNGDRLIRDSTSSQRINTASNNNIPSINVNATAQLKSIHRTSSSEITVYNGTTATNATQLSDVSLISQNQLVLRAGSFLGAHRVSMYAMGASLVSENSSFVTSFNTYITSL